MSGRGWAVSIETRFDIPFVAALALREKQIQQNYRPIIAVHKWFARRPGTLFRALALSEFGNAPLPDIYFEPNNFAGRKIADPFMGGGTPLIEANRVGCDVIGIDINPMSAWIVREEIEHLDLDSYTDEALCLISKLRSEIEDYYLTDCPLYGDTNVPVKYFLWVKVVDCHVCGESIDLFPGYIVSENARHPNNVLVCSQCGELNEIDHLTCLGTCQYCDTQLCVEGPARRGHCVCSNCGHESTYPRAEHEAPRHRLFAIEYFNPKQKSRHKGRFFKKPDEKDLKRLAAAENRWRGTLPQFVPSESIPRGDETGRLHRWGYTHYNQMFNNRQLLGLELSCNLTKNVDNTRIRDALATNFSDLLRYQNMLCRYDHRALKSLDIFSVHGFPIGLIQCESNLLGITNGQGSSVGSGAWTNIVDKYVKAKRYCDEPFEVQSYGRHRIRVPIRGESIGTGPIKGRSREVSIQCRDSGTANLEPDSLDAVLTDPPYFGNVQYAELMDFCYVWLRRLVDHEAQGFDQESTRALQELTGNVTQSRGLDHFTEGLSTVYANMAQALKPGAPLVFTYHHNKLEAYLAIGVSILDAGLICSASLPCPAEMGGSIHIHGTSSSIIDTIFVCRKRGQHLRQWLFESPQQLVDIVARDLTQIAEAGRTPSKGDTRCIIFGHMTRMAVWNLRGEWDATAPIQEKLSSFRQAISRLVDPDQLLEILDDEGTVHSRSGPLFSISHSELSNFDAVPF
jgi:hypothetical protein